MTIYFHGGNQRRPYFEGWYLKHQNQDGEALALIPAFHTDGKGTPSASLQILSPHGSWWLEYPHTAFQAARRQFLVRLGQSTFTEQGAELSIERSGVSLHGRLHYGPFSPLKSDIMGPFRFLPGLECSHGVASMGHRVQGSLTLNGKRLDFTDGTGYLERDRGRSFPHSYLWTQCLWRAPRPTSLMLSIAAIPLPLGQFTGCICSILHRGREYRLATYRGVQIEGWSDQGAVIRQGNYRLEVTLLASKGHPLRAPVMGSMGRTIHESLCAPVRYRFWSGKELIFDHTDPWASFEVSLRSR